MSNDRALAEPQPTPVADTSTQRLRGHRRPQTARTEPSDTDKRRAPGGPNAATDLKVTIPPLLNRTAAEPRFGPARGVPARPHRPAHPHPRPRPPALDRLPGYASPRLTRGLAARSAERAAPRAGRGAPQSLGPENAGEAAGEAAGRLRAGGWRRMRRGPALTSASPPAAAAGKEAAR